MVWRVGVSGTAMGLAGVVGTVLALAGVAGDMLVVLVELAVCPGVVVDLGFSGDSVIAGAGGGGFTQPIA